MTTPDHESALRLMGWRKFATRGGRPAFWIRPHWGVRIDPGHQWIGTIQADPELAELDDDPVRLARTLETLVTVQQPLIDRVARVGDLLVVQQPNAVQCGIVVRPGHYGYGIRWRLRTAICAQAPAERGGVKRWLTVAEVIDAEGAILSVPANGVSSMDEMRAALRPYLRPGVSQDDIIKQRRNES
ncbi:MAG TPA: hypothetical protein VIG24_14760 [Acidimicrobiia bacterium]